MTRMRVDGSGSRTLLIHTTCAPRAGRDEVKMHSVARVGSRACSNGACKSKIKQKKCVTRRFCRAPLRHCLLSALAADSPTPTPPPPPPQLPQPPPLMTTQNVRLLAAAEKKTFPERLPPPPNVTFDNAQKFSNRFAQR